MNYPDNFTTARFNATIGSRETEADQVYDVLSAQVNDAVKQAFESFPLDDDASAFSRWELICLALGKTRMRFSSLINLTASDSETIEDESLRASDANDENDEPAVSQNMGTILYVYRAALDRAKA